MKPRTGRKLRTVKENQYRAALRLITPCLIAPSASVCLPAAREFAKMIDLEDRAVLAWVVLRSLSRREAGWVIDALNSARTGATPLPTLLDPLDEARFWATYTA